VCSLRLFPDEQQKKKESVKGCYQKNRFHFGFIYASKIVKKPNQVFAFQASK
jgi:hypothetical protein